MKRIIFTSLAALIVFTGCSSQQNELISAINNSYDLDTGSITSTFDYSTEYDNIDIAGTVDGQIKILFGDDYDKVNAKVNFEDKKEAVEYYVDNKQNIITENQGSDVIYAPLYLEAPELDEYVDQIPEPKATTIKIDGKKVAVNKYSFKADSLNTDLARAMFEPIIKMGFVSSDVLKSDAIKGKFELYFYVDQETGDLVKEGLNFTNQSKNNVSTNTEVKIVNTYNYDDVTVELPEGYGETTKDDSSKANSKEKTSSNSKEKTSSASSSEAK